MGRPTRVWIMVEREFFRLQTQPESMCGPRLHFTGWEGSPQEGCDNDHFPPSSTEAEIEWSPSLCPHGTYRTTFNFSYCLLCVGQLMIFSMSYHLNKSSATSHIEVLCHAVLTKTVKCVSRYSVTNIVTEVGHWFLLNWESVHDVCTELVTTVNCTAVEIPFEK